MLTIILILVGVLTIVLAPFAPGWVTTTKGSFKAMAQQKELNEASMSTLSAIVPSQIAPWMASRAQTMKDAKGPLDWKVVSFRTGPCNAENLSQLPAGKYSLAIAQACVSLDDIQLRYSGNCVRASTCEIPEIARTEIDEAMNAVWDAFSDAGFVLPHDLVEQQVLP
ncbi:MAG: hypothetical protein O3B95_02200 [Chloroflexi bacterium]|nr:hypothetical protein [Chloroflexota bacterium]